MHGIHDIASTKLLTKVRVDFSDLRMHRYSHYFNCLSPICRCNLGEGNCHYFLHCPLYEVSRVTLLSNTSRTIDNDISVFPPDHLTEIILKRSNVNNHITNKLILANSIRKSGRFNILKAFFE